MIERIATFAVDQRVAVVIAVLLLAGIAIVPALRLPLDALPDLTNNQVIVLTSAQGLSPEEVELVVTRPIEIALSGLAGLVEQRSLSRYGISSVTAVFEDDVEAFRARQMVAERLATVALPEGVLAPELAPLTGGLGEIFHITLSSDVRTPAELLELTTLRVAPLLKSVKGVVEVNSWGGAQRTLDVIAQPALLASRGLTLRDMRDALTDASGASAGGALFPTTVRCWCEPRPDPRPPQTLALPWSALPAPTLRPFALKMWPRSSMAPRCAWAPRLRTDAAKPSI